MLFGPQKISSNSLESFEKQNIKLPFNYLSSRVESDRKLSLSTRLKNFEINPSKDFGIARKINIDSSPKELSSIFNGSAIFEEQNSSLVILENKELEILNSKIPSRAKSQRKSFAQKIHEPSLNLSMNNNNLTKTEKIYKLISKFYIIKKFVKYLRNAAYVRFPTKYEINRMDVLNDLSFFKEGLSLKQFQNEKKMIYCSDSYMLLIKLKFFCCKIFEFLVNRMGQYFTVFDPSKTLRSIWDALHLLVLSFYFFKIPIELSFDIHFFDYINEFNENISIFLNYFCIFFILLDIFFNFNTGYYKKGSLIAARKNIAKHYIKSGFFFDVASFIPLFLDFQKFGLNEYWNMLIFLRISTFFKIFSKIEESIHINFKLFNLLTLLKVVARIVLLSHLFACGWHAISLKYLNSTSNTWLIVYNLANEIWWKKYISSYYFVCVTMNTVGYGDMAPQNDTEKLFCIFFIYVACGIFAYTLNVVGNIIQQISKNKIKFLNNIMIINEFMNKKNINFDLRMRIRKYLEYVWMEEQYRNSEEENVIIDKLSNTLKEELLLETTGKILRQIPFFNNNFSEETLTKIVFKMKELHFMPGDKIFQKGDKLENSLYILLKGDVELYLDVVKKNESHQLIQKIEKGKIFGEKKFITGSEREVSARSSSFSTVYVLEFNDFLSVINGNFEDYAKFSEIKDNIHLYNDYKDVKICCSFCQDSNHTIITCAQMHLKVFKPRVIQKYLYHKPNERMQIIRRNKKTSNARKKQKLYRFIAKTIQKEHLFTEEDISDINALPSSERNSSENEEKISKLSEEYNESSEEGSIDQTKVINSNNPSTFRENTSKTSKPSKLNENKTSENKLLNPSENLARIASDDHLIKYSFDLMKNNSKLGLSMNKNISSNSIKIISGTNHANKENIEKKANIVDIVCFERKMDYENYFPLNNSENVINSYNKAQRTMKNNSDINKLTRRKTRTKFFRSKTHKKFSGLIKNPSCVNSKNIDLRKQNSPKKSGFFSKFDENQIKVDIMDRKAIIKLLENKKKEKEKSLLKKTFSWFRGLLKEGNN